MTGASGDGSLIAVVGVSCRLPHARGPAAYWQLLAGGGDAVAEISSERLALAGCAENEVRDLWEATPGARFGAFLDGVDRFDAAFFGLSAREARAVDPQQRL